MLCPGNLNQVLHCTLKSRETLTRRFQIILGGIEAHWDIPKWGSLSSKFQRSQGPLHSIGKITTKRSAAEGNRITALLITRAVPDPTGNMRLKPGFVKAKANNHPQITSADPICFLRTQGSAYQKVQLQNRSPGYSPAGGHHIIHAPDS